MDQVSRTEYGIEPVINFRVGYAERQFSEFKKGGATDTGDLLATSDAEIGKIDLSPKGCAANRATLCCRPRLGIAKVIVLCLVLRDFLLQRYPRES
jgi:hypothetical protein